MDTDFNWGGIRFRPARGKIMRLNIKPLTLAEEGQGLAKFKTIEHFFTQEGGPIPKGIGRDCEQNKQRR